MLARLYFFWRFQGRILFSCLFPTSRGCLYSLVHDPLSSSKYNHTDLSFCVPSPLTLTLLPPSFTYKDLCDYIEPTWIMQDNLSVSKSLTPSRLHSLSCQVRQHIHRIETSLGGRSAYHTAIHFPKRLYHLVLALAAVAPHPL